MQEVRLGERTYQVESVSQDGKIKVNKQDLQTDLIQIDERHYHLIIENRSYSVEVVDADAANPTIKINGKEYSPTVKGETDLLLEKLGMNIKTKKEVKELKAPMPGLVLDIHVKEGDEVKEGDPLIVLEAMKMENVLKAPNGGKVKRVVVKIGDAIDKNAHLIIFE